MKARFSHLRILAPADKFDECRIFYRDVLNFDVGLDAEENIYTEFKSEGVVLSLYQGELMANVLGEGRFADGESDQMSLIFEVDNVDQSFAELKAMGIEFATEPHDQEAWYLRVAHFRDPAGNLLEINHSLSVEASTS